MNSEILRRHEDDFDQIISAAMSSKIIQGREYDILSMKVPESDLKVQSLERSLQYMPFRWSDIYFWHRGRRFAISDHIAVVGKPENIGKFVSFYLK